MTFFVRAKWLAIKKVFCGGINNGIGQALLLCAMLAPLAIVAGCAGVVSGSTQTQPPPPASYSVTGTISPAAGGNGATVTLSGGASATTTANSSGVFSFASIPDGTYTLTPSKTAVTFTPTSLNITVSGGNVSGIAFTDAVQTFSISGTISPTAGGNGATVTLSGAGSATTTANSSGAYTFTGLANGIYTITPSKTGYTFNPGSSNATVSGANVTGVNFTDTAVTNPTFGISGTISPAAGGSGAAVTLTGAANASTTADGSGNYSFTGLSNGSYTVTPSKAGYSFTPGSLNPTVNGANVTGVNFTATALTYSISGTISSAANGSGATVTLSGAANATTTANSSGNYTFTGLANGTYTVTPSKTGFTFTPTSLNSTVNGANVTGINFTATAQTNPTYSISGTITGGSGVAVTLSGAASASTTANSSGNYSFSGLSNGSYTVTPSKAGDTFTPASANATVNGANVTGLNFTATAPTYSISGTISPTAGGSGATVTLSGAANATTTANSSGSYTFTGLTNGSYTVTPSNAGYTFTPASANATVNGANVTVNFTVAVQTFSISGTISSAANGSGATVTLSGAANATTTANSSGNYTFTGLANGTYTVTPSKTGLTFTPASANATVNGANVTGVNFTAVAPTFSISGTITPTAGGSGATVTLSGAANATTTTDGSGNYTFTSVSNGSYTVTPSNSGYTFTPASQSVTVNGANVTGVNFTAQVAVQAAAGAPVLFFTDLTSGPATGNSDTTHTTGGGVYVTLYGNFFGATQGTSSVALNGGSCLKVVSWGTPWLWYQKIVVQLTSSCASGNFTVTTLLGTSNGLSFAVTSGNIYFISGSGSDSASGSFTAPWKTINHAASSMAAGDTSYAQTGSDDTTDDGSGWSTSLLINSSGSAGSPISLVTYPGATVTIGSNSEPNAIRSGRTIPTNYWNVAGFTLRGSSVLATWGSNYWRMVGNDMSCPNGNGAGGCYVPIETTFLYTYGNNVHNTGVSGASAEYHAVYLATDSNDEDFGWNEIGFVNGGRGLQTHSAPNGGGTLGYSLFNMSIHDNLIHDTDLDCIVADTLSPNAGGPVTIYNNVFYNCGTTTPPESTGGWSGINIPGYTEAGPTSAGTVEIFNNTFYAYGLNTNPPYGGQENGIVWNGSGSSMSVHVRNNLLYSVTTSIFPSGVPYFAPSGSAQIYGVNNLVFGAGTSSGNSSITNTVSANPLLTNVTGFNFLPLTGSPAIGAGSPITGLTPFGINNIGRDINGNPRPATPSIGAYE
jgi:carboxypeptidase family protein